MKRKSISTDFSSALAGVEAAFELLKRHLGDASLPRACQRKVKTLQAALEDLRATLDAPAPKKPKAADKSEFVCVDTAMQQLQKRIEAEQAQGPPPPDSDATESDEPSQSKPRVTETKPRPSLEALSRRLSTEAPRPLLAVDRKRHQSLERSSAKALPLAPLPSALSSPLSTLAPPVPIEKKPRLTLGQVLSARRPEETPVAPTYYSSSTDDEVARPVAAAPMNTSSSSSDDDAAPLDTTSRPIASPLPVNAPVKLEPGFTAEVPPTEDDTASDEKNASIAASPLLEEDTVSSPSADEDVAAEVFGGGGWNDDSTEDEGDVVDPAPSPAIKAEAPRRSPVIKPEPTPPKPADRCTPPLKPAATVLKSPPTALKSSPTARKSPPTALKEPFAAIKAPSTTLKAPPTTLKAPGTVLQSLAVENAIEVASSSSSDSEARAAPTPRRAFHPVANPRHIAPASDSDGSEDSDDTDEPFPKRHLTSAPKVSADLWPSLDELYVAVVGVAKPALLPSRYAFPETYESLDEYMRTMKRAIVEEALTGVQDINQHGVGSDQVRFVSLSLYTKGLNLVAFTLPETLLLTNHDLLAISPSKDKRAKPFRGIVYSAANTNTKEVTVILSDKHFVSAGSYTISILSNLTTCSREFQAIAALPTLPPVLQNLIVAAHVPTTSLGRGAGIRPLMRAALEAQYNKAQLAAITAAVERPLTLIQGPPGTGKTRTIVGLIGALLSGSGMQATTQANARVCVGASLGLKLSEKDRAAMAVRLLVTAPSNAAVDVIIQRLQADGVYNVKTKTYEVPSMVRIGALPGLRQVPTSKRKSQPTTRTSSIYLEHLLDQQHAQRGNHHWNPMLARQELLQKAQIVFCTLSGAGSIAMCDFRQSFDAVIVDEAAQATEASSLIPLKFQATRWILVGDHKQLPATVLSQRLTKMGYETSMFQRLVASNEVQFLTKQYRMHPSIAQFPSAMFYDGQLTHGGRPRGRPYHARPELGPYVFYDIVQGEQSKAEGSTSYRNLPEVEFIVSLVTSLVGGYPDYSFRGKIGIISPYKSQIHELSSAFTKLNYRHMVEVNTVDGFQGREKEIIIVSCVRTVRGRENAFWGDVRRMNVALTRAISSCWVVGNSTLLSQNTAWCALIEDCKSRHCYRSVDL
ncbi:hypothetical protein ACHHYP_05326 [Achlya hypogyna]|uniref:P-loop containing nucleoside triphosphate hydrolase protein n=1 Tax=Achlya hypogyna TaxID=1202772 RepID=A0A1V9YY97_ACHHY|nr:hypothetical protein ACHHYP_05326 [Achlya hypogyna]